MHVYLVVVAVAKQRGVVSALHFRAVVTPSTWNVTEVGAAPFRTQQAAAYVQTLRHTSLQIEHTGGASLHEVQ